MSLRFLAIILLCSISVSAQDPKVWWIYFADKQGSAFDPYSYFDPAAIERREKNGVSLFDYSDFPVSPVYLAQVEELVDTLGYASRWMNAVSVVATDEQIGKIRMLPFVSEVVVQSGFEWASASISSVGAEVPIAAQLTQMQGAQFVQHNIDGKGINIAILDAGFAGVNTHEAFALLRFNNQVKATWNFLDNDTGIYDVKTDHGASVLSCIAGKNLTETLGMATGANFMLGIISKEYGNQYRAEEHYIAGVEWADKVGAHIINISGGPNQNAYFPEQRDGNTTVISFACKMAARKGILVVAAAGNNGERNERRLLAPAETDSVLSVTAIGIDWVAAKYSAIGPPPDFRRKPDICAPGDALVACRDKQKDSYAYSDGTSFSAPFATGFAACIMQLYPEITAMATIDTLHRCAHLYPYYDYSHGYGVPQAGYFFRDTAAQTPTFVFERDDRGVKIHIADDADSLSSNAKNRLLFWNITDPKGRIIEYKVIEVSEPYPHQVFYSFVNQNTGYKFCAWYRGYYAETDI